MPARLAYILGASHSGSTLLAMLLASHPDACTAGELNATHFGNPEQYRCSCGALIRECAFWGAIRQAMERRGVSNFDITRAGTSIYGVESAYASRLLAPLHRGAGLEVLRDFALGLSPVWRKQLRLTQRNNLALVESLLEACQAKILVDSSKVPLRLKYLLKNPGLDIQIIHLIRDGRAVSLTYTDEWSFADASDPALRGGGSGGRRPAPRRNMSEAAREWRRSNEAAECLLRALPRSRWLSVRYEELCGRPTETLRRIFGFLSLDPGPVDLRFRSRPQHVVGNGMRLDTTSEIRLDERWRSFLGEKELAEFELEAGRLNAAYGYR
jgi:hypothetical protein